MEYQGIFRKVGRPIEAYQGLRSKIGKESREFVPGISECDGRFAGV
jgi:hypothetical protein